MRRVHAVGLATVAGGADECAWYFINFVSDTTVGVVISILLIRLLEWWAERQPPGSWQRLYIAQSGDYGDPPACGVWLGQTMVWMLVVTMAKSVLFCFILSFSHKFGEWGELIFKPLQGNPQAELVIVMVIVPCFLNVSRPLGDEGVNGRLIG
jgi:hypothetical protein